jgi:hypothetical protein
MTQPKRRKATEQEIELVRLHRDRGIPTLMKLVKGGRDFVVRVANENGISIYYNKTSKYYTPESEELIHKYYRLLPNTALAIKCGIEKSERKKEIIGRNVDIMPGSTCFLDGSYYKTSGSKVYRFNGEDWVVSAKPIDEVRFKASSLTAYLA